MRIRFSARAKSVLSRKRPKTKISRAELTGVSVPFTRFFARPIAEKAAILDRLVDLGVKWLRVDFAPADIIPQQGVIWWDTHDEIVDLCNARGLKILGIFHTLPAWVRPPGAPWNYGPTTAAERTALTDYAVLAANRYPSVTHWEIWNEPNLDQFWVPTPTPDGYSLLLRQMYGALKAAKPNCTIIAGGTGWDSGLPDITAEGWYAALYENGDHAYFDAIAVHPYPDIGWTNGGQPFNGGEWEPMSLIRATMAANGDADKPMWGTEVGAPTIQDGSGLTEARQATLLTEVMDEWRRQAAPHGKTGPVFWYTLLDYDTTTREGMFGIVRANNTNKPAYGALKSWIASG